MFKTNCVTLRTAEASEVELIRSLAKKSWRAHYPGIISHEQIEYMLDWMYSALQLTDDIERGVEFVLLVSDQATLGFAGWESKGDTAYLHKLYLLPEVTGKGLGAELLKEVHRRAKQAGLRYIELGVNKYNHKAIRAYERFGFERIQSVCNDIGDGFVMDDYIYRLPL